MKIIAICGRKGTGKSTLGHELCRFGYYTFSFATPIKQMVESLLMYQHISSDIIYRMLNGDLKETPSEALGGHTPRYALQTIGNEWGRRLMQEDLWIAALSRAVGDGKAKVVITDLRYCDEAKFIKRRGGTIVRIEREGDSTDTHISEIEQRSIQADHTIVNDGTPLDMLNELVRLLGRENL